MPSAWGREWSRAGLRGADVGAGSSGWFEDQVQDATCAAERSLYEGGTAASPPI